jgi:predicted DNA-binding transcriptional regulator AlpA
MYGEKDGDGKRRYTVADISAMLGVSRQTIYRALEPGAVAPAPQKADRDG